MNQPRPEIEIATRPVTDADAAAIGALHARVFGPGRFVRTAYRLREGTAFASRYCRLAERDGRLVAAIRYTPIRIGETAGALLLGPLAVDPDFANRGYGRRLIAQAHDLARADGLGLVLLVGDMAYYGRLGFVAVPRGQIALPGPVDAARLLALELAPGALAGFVGLVRADA